MSRNISGVALKIREMHNLRIIFCIRISMCAGVLVLLTTATSELHASGVVHKRLQQNAAIRKGMAGQAAQLDPTLVDAINKVQEAIKMAQQASAIIKESHDTEHVNAAMDLFTQAGKRFEYAESVFSAAGDQYVKPEDLENCANAKNQCFDSAAKCREMLQ